MGMPSTRTGGTPLWTRPPRRRSAGWNGPRCPSVNCRIPASSGPVSTPWRCGSMATWPRRTVTRKRAVFHDALGYAAELGLLPANPLSHLRWKAPKAMGEVNPVTVASPAQVHAILASVAQIRPELTAFFACLYYAALRPEEAVALRSGDVVLPAHGWGKLILIRACPRTGSAWTSTGKPHQPRGLKHRLEGAIRIVPIPPVLVTPLRQHLQNYGTTADGRLFRGARGGMLSESVYGRAWHTARRDALGPVLAATPLARRPYDLRHAALSLWLTATGAPAEIAARAGNSVTVLHTLHSPVRAENLIHGSDQHSCSPGALIVMLTGH